MSKIPLLHKGACFLLWAYASSAAAVDPCAFVDPFVGTSATGHTFPAACVPFGLVQAGPDTGNGTWHYCSGYRYDDKTILGFSQTHLNGTGCPDLGDIRILPFEKCENVKLCKYGNMEIPNGIAFDKSNEAAEPGYYAVTLDGGIKVEVAAAEHSAIYRVTGKDKIRLLVDCAYGIGGKNYAKTITASDVKLVGKSGLVGKNHRRQWVERDYSFVVTFSRESAAIEELPKAEGIVAPQYVFDFNAGESPLLVKIALSAEDGVEAAKRNLAAEIPEWDFDAVKGAARAKWNAVLSRATVEGSDDQKKNWYTSLYHLFIQPNNIADVGAKPFYSTFSTWDTFRAAHPLYTILAPEKAAEFVDSMLEQGRRTGYLPIWTLWGKDNQCMIGTHSVPVIVDLFLKEGNGEWGTGNGLDFSHKEHKDHKDSAPSASLPLCVKNKTEYWLSAYAQIKDTLTKPHKGRRKERWDLLDKYGYYPFDEIRGESVSRTMECAYDDWCAAQMAQKLGEWGTGNVERDESLKADAVFFFKRSENWRNVFDPSIGLVRGKDSRGNWREPFDPYALGWGADKANDFTEGNAFQYTWHVMQNPQGLIDTMGGRDAFVKKLDSLFVAPSKTDGMGEVLDVTGLIGQYVHGNEPSHHVIYFYPQVGHPEKAAERIREVFDKFYLPKPDGLCGNDDCGQMSAWYLFSAMGFYPFNPCGGEYIIGAPQVAKVELQVGRGACPQAAAGALGITRPTRAFTVIARNLSPENKYVKSVTLNGKPITDWKIRHADIMSGGELVFEMGPNFAKALRVANVSSPGKDIFVFGRGEKATVAYTVENAATLPFTGNADISLETHKGKILHKMNAAVEIAPGGKAQIVFDAVSKETPYGVYYTRLALSEPSAKTPVLVREGSLLVGPTNILRHAKDGEFMFGLDPCQGFHGDHSELLKWARWMGADILRYGVNRRCARQQEADILKLRAEGMRVLAVADGSRKDDYNEFLAEQTEVDAFVKDFAARVRPPFWELGNEPDLPYFFRPGIVRYMEGYGRMYAAIKSADPEAKVMNGGLCRPMGKFDRTEKFFDLVDPAKIDYVAYHAHGIGYTAEERQFRHMKAHAAAVGKPSLKFCDTETGISARGRDPELLQASTCVQKFVFALENDLPFMIWFRLYFKGREEGYGNLEAYKEPRPVVLAYRTLVERLREFEFDRRIDAGSDAVKVFLFRGKDGSKNRVAVCWSDSPGRLALEGVFGGAICYDIFGNKKKLAAEKRLDAKLSPVPVYLEWTSGKAPESARFEVLDAPGERGVLVLGEASIDNYFVKEPDGSKYWQGEDDLSVRAAARRIDGGCQVALAVRDSRHLAPAALLGPEGDFVEIADAKGLRFKAGLAADGETLSSGGTAKVRRDASRGETRYSFNLPPEAAFPLAVIVHDDDWGEPKQKAQGVLKDFKIDQTKEKSQ